MASQSQSYLHSSKSEGQNSDGGVRDGHVPGRGLPECNKQVDKDEMFICQESRTSKANPSPRRESNPCSSRYRLDALASELRETVAELDHLLG